MPQQGCKDLWNNIPDDEPVFIVRGKDLLAADIVSTWMMAAARVGVSTTKLQAVEQVYRDIQDFQRCHADRCKIPD